MPQNDGSVVIENAEIIFKNFSGNASQYNAEGDRNFCLLLDPRMADEMAQDGWNVKLLRPREEGDEPRPYVQVSLRYRGRSGAPVRPPILYLVTSRNRTPLSEDECGVLDWVDIANVDLIVRPYRWNVNGKSGVKAYLKAIYVTIVEDPLMKKYADLPEMQGGTERAAIMAGPDEGDDDIIEGEAWDADDQRALPAGRR